MSGSPEPGESPTPAGPIAIAGASDFDPETDGGNDEEGDAVAKAIDGDPATYWETLRYKNRPNLGGLKPGVGVVLDLGEKRTVTAVELMLSADNPEDPTSVEIRVPEGSKPSTRTEADWTVVGANDRREGNRHHRARHADRDAGTCSSTSPSSPRPRTATRPASTR